MVRPIGLEAASPHATKLKLLQAGLALLLERGYTATGVQDVLDATGVPKGSFYHHFKNKQNFALGVIDRYVGRVHELLDAALSDASRTPLERVRNFFEQVMRSYQEEGYLGCLLGALGQELCATSAVFRRKIDACLTEIGARIARCLEEARWAGELPGDTDTGALANVLVDCWEGAALRSRLLRDRTPLSAVLDFYFRSVRAV